VAALDFPSSPTVGQTYTANGRTWQWDGVSWNSFNTIVAAGSNTQIQFNNSGAFGASSNLTWNGTTLSTTGLSVSSTVTINGGTANGVGYLNASKVLTTGSALTFDGTNLSTTGTATATKLVPTGNVTAGNGMYLPTTDTLAWSTNGTERARITSTGVFQLGNAVSLNPTTANALTLDSSGNLAVAGTLSSKTQVIRSTANTAFLNPSSITRATAGISVSGTTSTCTVTFNSPSSWTNAVIRVRCACTTGGGGSEGAAETIYYTRHVSSTTARTIVATNVTTSAGLVLSIAYGTGTATVTATVATGVYALWDVEVSNFISATGFTFA
jgi:hypothetical protein